MLKIQGTAGLPMTMLGKERDKERSSQRLEDMMDQFSKRLGELRQVIEAGGQGNPGGEEPEERKGSAALGTEFVPDQEALAGAWSAMSDVDHVTAAGIKGLRGKIPAKFAGLATPEKNPMSMQLSHEEVVVGCADGTI